MDPYGRGSLRFSKVYEAIERDEKDKDYLVNVALAAFEVIKHENIPEARKNNTDSEYYREEGNEMYKDNLLQKALESYNKAIAYAPNGSLYLKLAYSNRSALLFTAKDYTACIKDCTTALAINCTTPNSLTKKLIKRISQAQSEQKFDFLLQRDKVKFQKFGDEFFKLKRLNNDVPCVSADVDIVFESEIPKIIAKRDIAAGTLVGLEKAFVTWSPTIPNQYFSCHYCRKRDLNLFPCSGCVFAMFCSEECEENCFAEYHTDECKIAGFITNINITKSWLIKTVLKLVNMSASWDVVISMSYDYGCSRIKKGTPNDIYDGENPSSILSFHIEHHFLYGLLFNTAIDCAYCLRFLLNLQSFLPEDWEKRLLATNAIARILMYLNLNATPTTLPLVAEITTSHEMCHLVNINLGLFPFIGKLKHSCMPNLQTLSLNNSVALVAFEEIKAGEELTISRVCHWLDDVLAYKERRLHMLIYCNTVCTCIICSASPIVPREHVKLTEAQESAIRSCVPLDVCRSFDIPIEKIFENIYKALTSLHNIPFSTSYAKMYVMLYVVQMHVLYYRLHNKILSKDDVQIG